MMMQFLKDLVTAWPTLLGAVVALVGAVWGNDIGDKVAVIMESVGGVLVAIGGLMANQKRVARLRQTP